VIQLDRVTEAVQVLHDAFGLSGGGEVEDPFGPDGQSR
jgi:hypothetical protein